MYASTNPYAPPLARVSDVVAADSNAEAIRREHIKHEASVRSVGVLYYMSGGICAAGAVALVAVGLGGQESVGIAAALSVVYGAFAGLSFALGRGLRQLRPWARTVCTVLSAIGLIAIPLGTLINGYILYLLRSAKGRRLFEPDYPAIVEATPHVAYRSSAFIWVLGILIVLMLVGIAAAILIPALVRI